MASLRVRTRSDGTAYTSVRYRHGGKETSTSFEDHADAVEFGNLIDKYGAGKALEIHKAKLPASSITLTEWLGRYLDHLTGPREGTMTRYRSIVDRDITPALGDIPLMALNREDVVQWVQGMQEAKLGAKTILNKHGLLSAALNVAVIDGHIPNNPCKGVRLPKWNRREMVFLERDEYRAIYDQLAEHWHPLIEFLVASGCRWSEATALTPADVDRKNSTVRIHQAWNTIQGGYVLGAPKTRRSKRTINVPKAVLNMADYSGEYLFTNRAGNPVRANTFGPQTWNRAVAKATVGKAPRVHDLRHTCASWMINAGIPIAVVSRHLGHESIQTTMDIYGHLDRESGKAAAAAIAAVLGDKEKEE